MYEGRAGVLSNPTHHKIATTYSLQYTCGILIKIVFVHLPVAIFSKRWFTKMLVVGGGAYEGSIIDGCPIIAPSNDSPGGWGTTTTNGKF